MEAIELHLDQDNELRFNVVVEGSEEGSPDYRLMLETDRMSLGFSGKRSDNGEISVIIPTLSKVLKEGNYNARLEVRVEDRVFVPLNLVTYFKKAVKVTAESVSRPKAIKVPTATATLVETKASPPSSATKPEKMKTKRKRELSEDDMRALVRELLSKKS